MERDAAIALLDRLHEAQNEFYTGGSGAAPAAWAARLWPRSPTPAPLAAVG